MKNKLKKGENNNMRIDSYFGYIHLINKLNELYKIKNVEEADFFLSLALETKEVQDKIIEFIGCVVDKK